MSYHAKALFREESNIKSFCRDFGVGRGCTCFMTGTFKENITDKKEAVYYWNILRTQLVKIYKIFRYICVWERQERGAWHFHIIFNCPSMPSVKQFKIVLQSILDCSDTKWGFIQVKWTKGNYKSIGNYMFKYLTKSDREPYVRYINYSRNFLRCCSSQFMFVGGMSGVWRACCRTLDEMFPDTFRFFYYHTDFDALLKVVNGCNGDTKSFFNGLQYMFFFYNHHSAYGYNVKFLRQLSSYVFDSHNFLKQAYPVGQLKFNF